MSFRQHVSAVNQPSSGLYRASYVKYNGFDTQRDPNVFTVVLQNICYNPTLSGVYTDQGSSQSPTADNPHTYNTVPVKIMNTG